MDGIKSVNKYKKAKDFSGNLWVSEDGVFVTIDTTHSQTNNLLGEDPQEEEVVTTQFVVEEEEQGLQENAQNNNNLEALATAAASRQKRVVNAKVIVDGKIFPPANLTPLSKATLGLTSASTLASSEEVKLFCGECSLSFANGDGFFQHWLENHCRPAKPGENLNPSEKKTQQQQSAADQCKKCDSVFVRGSPKFLEHKAKCSNKQKRKWQTSSSKAKKLAVNTNVSCGVCSTELKTITSFFLHWLETHNNIMDILEEVWSCHSCLPNKLFPNSYSTASHVKENHSNTETLSKCRQCEALFSDKDRLTNHEESHKGRVCSDCQKEVENLSQHALEFHEQKCEVCGCQVQRSRTKEHFSTHHKFDMIWNRNKKLQELQDPLNNIIVIPPDPSSSSTLIPTPVATQVKANRNDIKEEKQQPQDDNNGNKKCRKCSLVFTSEKLLEKHYFSNHEFQCRFCALKMDKDLYGDHLRIHLASERMKISSSAK